MSFVDWHKVIRVQQRCRSDSSIRSKTLHGYQLNDAVLRQHVSQTQRCTVSFHLLRFHDPNKYQNISSAHLTAYAVTVLVGQIGLCGCRFLLLTTKRIEDGTLAFHRHVLHLIFVHLAKQVSVFEPCLVKVHPKKRTIALRTQHYIQKKTW